MSKPCDVSDLISKWPSVTQFAQAIGCGYQAAIKMRNRGTIAPRHWPAVINAAKRQKISGVNAEWLSNAYTHTSSSQSALIGSASMAETNKDMAAHKKGKNKAGENPA